MNSFLFKLVLVLTITPVFSHCKQVCFYDNKNPVGMFSAAFCVMGCLELYEQGQYSGVLIDFKKNGYYYDPEHGPNWWNYYFEPISIGSIKTKKNIKPLKVSEFANNSFLAELSLSRQRAHQLIQKYIKVKPFVLDLVDEYVKAHFRENQVIGVHYRGTDKDSEAPRTDHNKIVELLLNQPIFQNGKTPIFVATDEEKFLEFMNDTFPLQVYCYEGVYRSTTKQAIHTRKKDNFKKGLDALIDCLILSRCDLLIKTSSNLSHFSTYFNPNIPVIHASERKHVPKKFKINSSRVSSFVGEELGSKISLLLEQEEMRECESY